MIILSNWQKKRRIKRRLTAKFSRSDHKMITRFSSSDHNLITRWSQDSRALITRHELWSQDLITRCDQRRKWRISSQSTDHNSADHDQRRNEDYQHGSLIWSHVWSQVGSRLITRKVVISLWSSCVQCILFTVLYISISDLLIINIYKTYMENYIYKNDKVVRFSREIELWSVPIFSNTRIQNALITTWSHKMPTLQNASIS